MTSAARWSVAVGVESLLVVLILPIGVTFTGHLILHQAQVALLALSGAIGWMLVMWRPWALPRAVLAAPLPVLAALVISAAASRYPTLSWFATWQVAAYVGVGWLLALQASRPDGRRNLIAVVGIVVTAALVSYARDLTVAWVEWLELGFPLTSVPLRPLNSGGLALIPTWLADLISVGSPVVIAALWGARARALAVLLGVAVVGELLLTGTRSVLLIVVALGILSAVGIARSRRAGRAVIALVTLGLGLAGAAGILLLNTPREFDEGRSSAFSSAVDLFRSSPILGTGPGTFGVGRMRHAVDALGHLAFPDAHNIVLTTLAETGLIGLVALGFAVALYAMSVRRAWRATPENRPIIAGALFGIAVFAGHGMVDVVFAMVGIVLVLIAVIALSTTSAAPPTPSAPQGSRALRPALAAGLGVVIVVSALAIREERTLAAMDQADANLSTSPGVAMRLADEASSASPDYVPAWWLRMLAADAQGDAALAIASAHRIVELEGFGQEWMNLAILASRAGDRTTALDALGHAAGGPPIDPIVELNAAVLLEAGGDSAGARAAIGRLLRVQPDVEPILAMGPPELARMVAGLRPDVAAAALEAGDPDSAFVVALAGEDRSLAEQLMAALAQTRPDDAGWWRSVVDGWFGDASARASIDQSAGAGRRLDRLLWAWRIAAHACDDAGAGRWERIVAIGFSYLPVAPVKLGMAPGFQASMLPVNYPAAVWRLNHPSRPYVAGTWSFSFGRPSCPVAQGQQ